MTPIHRMWINCPSDLQEFHKLHGTNVLAYREGEGMYRVYFLSGTVVSQQMPYYSLSNGWLSS